MHRSRIRLIAGFSACLLFSSMLGVCLGGGSDQGGVGSSAPVTPVIPAPNPPAGHHIRFQDLLPGKNGKGVESKSLGTYEAAPETGPELSLGECIAVALERQPTLKAAQDSLKSAEDGYRALMAFGTVGTIISPDLEIRKQQAQRGLAASSAELQKAHNEVVQDVTRMYYTAVYARQQYNLANETVETLSALAIIIQDILNSKLPLDQLGGLNMAKLDVVLMGVDTSKSLRLKAGIGREQALAALRQIMAVDEKSFPFRLKDKELPQMSQSIPITRELVVEQALARRPELALAAAGVDVFRLEVYAQGKIPLSRKVPTFASGSDLHAREVPAAIRGKDYRPGAIIPEMPTQLVGSKCERVNRAMALSQRAEEVFTSAQSLVTLEAENAYYEYKLASGSLSLNRNKLAHAMDLQKRTREKAESIKEKDQIVQSEITTAKVQADYIESLHEYIESLAALERITAGGVHPEFPGR
jgi:outer membrane protein TolC